MAFDPNALPPEMMGGPMGAPPPDMLGQLMGGPQGPPPGPPQDEDLSDEEHVRTALEHLEAALSNNTDDIESSKIAKVVQACYDLLGQRQKETESALGTSPAMKAMGRAYGA